MAKYYILKDKEIIEVNDPVEWAECCDTVDCQVGRDRIGDVEISTVFRGTAHSFESGKPLVFETMIFSSLPEWNGQISRYATYEEPEEGHKEMVKTVREAILN